MTEKTHEEMKEEEQAVIQRQIEATNAQLETLERMEASGNPTMTEEELMVGIYKFEISDFLEFY